jgi:hypothetical protein
MTKIKGEDIQPGDKIRVTDGDDDWKIIREVRVKTFEPERRYLLTPKGVAMFLGIDSIIELLERPEPTLEPGWYYSEHYLGMTYVGWDGVIMRVYGSPGDKPFKSDYNNRPASEFLEYYKRVGP